MDKAGVPPRASLVLLVACTGEVPIISDEHLDAFAQIGHALAPEKVRPTYWLPQYALMLSAYSMATAWHTLPSKS